MLKTLAAATLCLGLATSAFAQTGPGVGGTGSNSDTGSQGSDAGVGVGSDGNTGDNPGTDSNSTGSVNKDGANGPMNGKDCQNIVRPDAGTPGNSGMTDQQKAEAGCP